MYTCCRNKEEVTVVDATDNTICAIVFWHYMEVIPMRTKVADSLNGKFNRFPEKSNVIISLGKHLDSTLCYSYIQNNVPDCLCSSDPVSSESKSAQKQKSLRRGGRRMFLYFREGGKYILYTWWGNLDLMSISRYTVVTFGTTYRTVSTVNTACLLFTCPELCLYLWHWSHWSFQDQPPIKNIYTVRYCLIKR